MGSDQILETDQERLNPTQDACDNGRNTEIQPLLGGRRYRLLYLMRQHCFGAVEIESLISFVDEKLLCCLTSIPICRYYGGKRG